MDLTARENIYCDGTVLGYTPKYIDSKFEDIVEFSELRGLPRRAAEKLFLRHDGAAGLRGCDDDLSRTS